MPSPLERRLAPRHLLSAPYHPLTISTPSSPDAIEGNAYDISLTGLRFESDALLPPGSRINLVLHLPATPLDPSAPNTVSASANVVWVDDDDAPPPYRSAAVFTFFTSPADELRLRSLLRARPLRAAA